MTCDYVAIFCFFFAFLYFVFAGGFDAFQRTFNRNAALDGSEEMGLALLCKTIDDEDNCGKSERSRSTGHRSNSMQADYNKPKRQAAVDDITPDNKTTEENYQRVLSDVEQKSVTARSINDNFVDADNQKDGTNRYMM